MAIQITEKNLSPEVKRELDNTVNKSQLLRDALEFYVRRGQISQSDKLESNADLREELKEIKSMLAQLTSNCIVIDKKYSEDISHSSNDISIKEIEISEATCIDKAENNEEVGKIEKVEEVVISKENKNIDRSPNNEIDEEDEDIPECYR